MKSKLILLPVIYLLIISASSCSNHGQLKDSDVIAETNRNFVASDWPDRIMQCVSENPQSEISLTWRTSKAISEGYAEYTKNITSVKSDDKVQVKQAKIVPVSFENHQDHYFQVRLDGLEPSSSYMVRVGNDQYRSEWFSVLTAPSSFEPFSFLYFGDVQNDIKEYAPRIFRHASANYPDARFILHSGDLVLSSGNDDTWGEWFYAGNWLLQQIPSMVAAGNSDHFRWQNEPVDKRLLFSQWHGSFLMPANGPKGFENLVYHFDYPGIRIISLYSNFESTTDNDREIYIRPETMLTENMFHKQILWLEEILESNTQPWLAVLMHHPVFTARQERDNELMQEYFLPLFEKYKVDIVFQGHDHVYARGINPEMNNSTPVYVISIAGGKMRKVDKSHQWIYQSIENTQLYQTIHITENMLEFKAIDLEGSTRDKFQIILENNKKSLKGF